MGRLPHSHVRGRRTAVQRAHGVPAHDHHTVLVLQGDDRFHPRSASRLIAAAVPGAVLVERWQDDHLPAARATIEAFLAPLHP